MNTLTKGFFLIMLALLAVSCSTSNQDQVDEPKQTNSQKAIQRLHDSPFQLKDYHGEILLVAYWATWCKPCVTEVPTLIELQNKYGDEDFTVIGISVDKSQTLVKKFIAKKGINYPVYMADESVEQIFGTIFGLPTTFLLDANGEIIQKNLEYLPPEGLEMTIRSIMKK